ncbi:hypothetical protein [Jannaschia rubra]|uniref:hypothetical protein n=1 Tax=Jannaschia rubra TaxID=282197 RepID=UPI00248F6B39|nr:hypothetical protein [Jannaschia rubra]
MKLELAEAKAELIAAHAALKRAETALQRAIEGQLRPASIFPAPTGPITEHRRLHRSGCAPKIESDPELRAFLEARISRMTFEAMAKDVAEHFPNGRRISRSAIHAWARRSGLIPK